MTPFTISFAALLYALSVTADDLPHPLSDDFINLINTKQTMWTAGRNFAASTPFEHIKRLMGVRQDVHSKKLPEQSHDVDLIASLPESFDPRDKWPNCPTLNEIRDQGSCGSCWALGAVEAMTDRVCIYSNGTQHFHFSAEDLLSCCDICGNGCDGGNAKAAWDYWKMFGIVSGGNYNSTEGCMPYKIPSCEHFDTTGKRKPCSSIEHTPECIKTCKSNYNVTYEKDKRYAKKVYSIPEDEGQIKAELYKNGPVEVSFTVFADFLTYKSGVYKHTKGEFEGYHAVKILGWGIEKGNKYWLIANSWNSDWGNKGYVKFLRGENHCNIEEGIVAGEPAL